ncbi:type II toxin-antitoxin system VapC family toxin [Endothiovibrio diazotrophicus]
MSYLLDTNILSEPTRAAPHPGVMERLRRHGAAVATAAPVVHELRFGIERLAHGRRRAALSDYLRRLVEQPLLVLPYDRAAALWHGEVRARLMAEGRTPAFVDGQIAAIAVLNQRVLVTRNHRDFADFPGLRVENWFEMVEWE